MMALNVHLDQSGNNIHARFVRSEGQLLISVRAECVQGKSSR